MAMGQTDDDAHGALRLTLSENTTIEELDYTIAAVKKSVNGLRTMSS